MALRDLADVVGGTLHPGAAGGDAAGVVVDGPAVVDGREARPGGLFAAFAGEHVDGHEHAAQAGERGAVAALGSRPTVLPTVVVDDVREALLRLAEHVLARLREGGDLVVLAVTGSHGKTSTKDLLAGVLADAAPTVATAGSFNNELGVPLTVLRAEPGTRFLLLEMGARGVGHLRVLTDRYAPDVSLVLNVGSSHLGEFGSVAAIARAKGELVEGLVPGGTAVLNADDDRVAAMAVRAPGRVVRFGTGSDVDVRLGAVALDRLGHPRTTLTAGDETAEVALQVVGAHQAANAAAAAATALAVGIPLDRAAASLGRVEALSERRLQVRRLEGDVTLLDDTFNANPESVRAALEALAVLGEQDGGHRTIAALGEMLELGPDAERLHRETGRWAVQRLGPRGRLLVVGAGARALHDGALDAGGDSTFVETIPDGVAWLRREMTAGDVVLVKSSRGARLKDLAAALP